VIQRLLSLEPVQAQRVSSVTQIFLIGIIGHSLVELFVRSFYAMQKPRFPLLGSFLTLVVFLGLGSLLMPTIGAAGIATANTVAYALQAVLLFVLLNRTLKFGSEMGKPV